MLLSSRGFAVALAAEEKYSDAIRLVEACLRLEPYETAHFQNRATLFTLTREPDAYHAAWFELNRHQYRLALLGKLTADSATKLAKPHRLFAQQARFSPSQTAVKSDAGVFIETIRPNDVEKSKILAVNQEKLDDDPELLRQWVHHHRAGTGLFAPRARTGRAAVPAAPGQPQGRAPASRGWRKLLNHSRCWCRPKGRCSRSGW